MKTINHLLMKNDVQRIVDAAIVNYENALYVHKLDGSEVDSTNDLYQAISRAIDEVLDEPKSVEYSANLSFLILLGMYQEGLKLNNNDDSKRRVSNYEYQLYIDVESELIDVYRQYYKRNKENHDDEDDDWNAVYVDAYEEDLDDALVDAFGKSFESGNWEPFKVDAWTKSRFRPFAVVALSE